jgi:hypothetical protein
VNRDHLLRATDPYVRYYQVPIPTVVKWKKAQDRHRDPSELMAQFYPVREDVIGHLKQIYEAFNGYQIGEAFETVGTEGTGGMFERMREFLEERMHYVIQQECERLGRVIVFWFPMQESGHPVLDGVKVLAQRVITIPLLTSWPEEEKS